MTFTVSPWVVWAVASLALFGARWLGSSAWHALRDGCERLAGWLRRDRVAEIAECCDDCGANLVRGEEHRPGCVYLDEDDLPPLPPERTWEQMTSHQLPLADHKPWSPASFDPPVWEWHAQERERRAPWWEAEHRAAYESLGLDYPSGLLARVREAAQ